MKKFLFFIVILLSLASCDSTVKVPEERQAKETTLEVLQNVDTTLQVSIVEDYTIYVLKDDVVVKKARAKDGGNFFITLLVGFFIGLLTGLFVFID